MKKIEVISWQTWTIVSLGLWLVLSAFLQFDSLENLWNNMLIGFFVAYIGFSIREQKEWQSWVCLIVGSWMFISALIPSLVVGQGYILNNFISGSIITMGGFVALKNQLKYEN